MVRDSLGSTECWYFFEENWNQRKSIILFLVRFQLYTLEIAKLEKHLPRCKWSE